MMMMMMMIAIPQVPRTIYMCVSVCGPQATNSFTIYIVIRNTKPKNFDKIVERDPSILLGYSGFLNF